MTDTTELVDQARLRASRKCADGYAVPFDVNLDNALADTIERLREALGLALHVWSLNEPGDSRAVSDEFVACAAVEAGLPDLGEAMGVIRRARATLEDEP